MSEEVVTSGKVGSSFTDIFGSGLTAVMDAGRAVAIAVETQQLSVDPHLVDAMIKKLNGMKDALDRVMQRSAVLSQDTKLGGGYAEQISASNRTFGEAAQQTLRDLLKAIDELKTQIEKSRATYKASDQDSADSMKKLGK
ncbi:type VII secretion target [Lentzea sp. JNUCC 0626]|uniref:type VII secretion target n=1 Tax=Lentzea sp. JNUCC 0626 TaxID=3367513 RepID=UPI0037482C34